MKHKIVLMLVLCMSFGAGIFAQDKDDRKESKEDRKADRDEKNAEKKAAVKDKTDYTIFHRQMLALKEFSEERRKIPALQKANKSVVKVTTAIDSADDEARKSITGYIVQTIGDNTVNLYEVTFDRGQKKIISVKRTQEAADAEKSEKAEKDEKAEDKKTEVKKTTRKKTKDEDEDEDEDDKPSKKDKDEDKE